MKFLMTIAFIVGACTTSVSGPGDLNGDDPNGADPSGADAGPAELDPDATVPDEPELVVTVLSQGTGTPVVNTNVNCRYGEQGPNADTRHYRLFPASSIGGTTITEAILPIEVADSPNGPQPATLKFHRLTGDILAGEFELISETAFVVPNQGIGEVRVPVTALEIAPAESIVVEVAMADGAQQRNLRFGYNLEMQTGATYYASDACGQALPKDLATLDNPFVAGTTFAANSWLVSLTTERLQ